MDTIDVLIVEDDTRVAKIHAMYLQKVEGFSLIGIAGNIDDALFMVREIKPKLILLDLYFPDKNGMDLLYTLRSEHADVDVILITAANDSENINKALKGGAFDYIIKPVFFERFTAALEKYKQRYSILSGKKTLTQESADAVFGVVRELRQQRLDLPKGIEAITLDEVAQVFENCQEQGLSASEVGSAAGLSRTTARKYLEYLYSLNILDIKLEYGTIGRPERRYVKKL
ncbi:response regulator [Seleniivibrio sp.]|uniref:response regulator n=1 Tax=Seleniivibrio sp. TaxID=2898801 RepID=UPI0025E75C6B|nr:response regulator [Seleniivibrio sp.]MCD8554394.1 response regulator [Seleniivibrio sp.]